MEKIGKSLQFGGYRGTTEICWEEVLSAVFGEWERHYKVRRAKANLPLYSEAAYLSWFGSTAARVLWTPGKAGAFFDLQALACTDTLDNVRKKIPHKVTSAVIGLETGQLFAFDDMYSRCKAVSRFSSARCQQSGHWNSWQKDRQFSVGSRSTDCQIVLRELGGNRRGWWFEDDEDLVRLTWHFRLDGPAQNAAASYTPVDFLDLCPMGSKLAWLILEGGVLRESDEGSEHPINLMQRGFTRMLPEGAQQGHAQELVYDAIEAGLRVLG